MSSIQGRCETLQRCVVVGGAGAVGDMFARLLEEAGAQVCVLDITPLDVVGSARCFEHADIMMPNQLALAEVGEADLVLLAVSERVALAAIPLVMGALKPGALLAETLSVKSRVTSVVRTEAPRAEVVGLNPMFAPSLGMAGNPVAAVITHGGPRTCELLRLVTAWGGQVVQMDAEEHDRVVTAVQVLTHAAVLAFGFALTELDIGIEELSALASPPHVMMLARIVSGTPEVYWDVQSANPQAPKAREALIRGARQLADHIATGDETAFVEGLEQTRETLGGELDRYREICAQAFDSLRRPR